MTTALVDGDVIVYSVGFMLDQRYYKVGRRKFKYKKDAKAFCLLHNIPEDQIKFFHKPGKEEKIEQEIVFFLNKLRATTCVDGMKIFLTGDSNFRKDEAHTHIYKGNRKSAARPFLYDNIRTYLVDECNALVVHGIEADDAMGIAQSDDTIICSIDKDMLTVPGHHYNWKSEKFIFQSETDADTFLHRQMITGDRTDNIFGVVPDTPYQIAKYESILKPLSYIDQVKYVGMQYAITFDDPEDRINENYSLLRIMRHESELTNPVRIFDIDE